MEGRVHIYKRNAAKGVEITCRHTDFELVHNINVSLPPEKMKSSLHHLGGDRDKACAAPKTRASALQRSKSFAQHV